MHTGTKEKNIWLKQIPPWLESHCLCRTPCQNPGKHKVCQGRCSFPTTCPYSCKRNMPCFTLCLEKEKNNQILLKEVHYNTNLHFTLHYKISKGQICLRASSELLLKATAFVSIPAYLSMMVWTSSWNEENCAGICILWHQNTAPFSKRNPFHHCLMRKDITLTVFRTI